ncbi:hypothetical protein KR009_001866, partial [Drosophila setifemur]
MFSAADLARLCRICLRQLKDPQNPNPRLVFLLKKFLDIDLLQQDKALPKEICNLCHNAMVYFEELCQVARETSEKLYGQLKGREQDAEQPVERVKDEPLDPDDKEFLEEKQETQAEAEASGAQLQQQEREQEAGQQENEHEHEQDPIRLEPSPKKPRSGLACDQCGKQVYKLPYLEAHIRSVHQGHSKPFLCRSCDKSFTRYEQLRSHMRNVHPQLQQLQELRALICELCNRQYSTKNALGEHLKRHAQRKEHVCEHCGVAKVTRTELLTHLRTHNPTWERFKCEQCPQLFRHKSAISRHVRVVHEGQRRFQCGRCEKRFGTHASQLRHERLHCSGGEGEGEAGGEGDGGDEREGGGGASQEGNSQHWPFSCIHCQEPCVTRQKLELHLRRHVRRMRESRQHLEKQKTSRVSRSDSDPEEEE